MISRYRLAYSTRNVAALVDTVSIAHLSHQGSRCRQRLRLCDHKNMPIHSVLYESVQSHGEMVNCRLSHLWRRPRWWCAKTSTAHSRAANLNGVTSRKLPQSTYSVLYRLLRCQAVPRSSSVPQAQSPRRTSHQPDVLHCNQGESSADHPRNKRTTDALIRSEAGTRSRAKIHGTQITNQRNTVQLAEISPRQRLSRAPTSGCS